MSQTRQAHMQWSPAYTAERAHLLQHAVDVRHDILPVHKYWCVGPVPQCRVQHSTVLPQEGNSRAAQTVLLIQCKHVCVWRCELSHLSEVDLLSGEHAVPSLLHPSLPGLWGGQGHITASHCRERQQSLPCKLGVCVCVLVLVLVLVCVLVCVCVCVCTCVCVCMHVCVCVCVCTCLCVHTCVRVCACICLTTTQAPPNLPHTRCLLYYSPRYKCVRLFMGLCCLLAHEFVCRMCTHLCIV